MICNSSMDDEQTPLWETDLSKQNAMADAISPSVRKRK